MHKDLILGIHYHLVEHFAKSDDPLEPCGTKSDDLLESACARPFMTAHGKEIFSTEYEKAAALFHAIISNHCFQNGNKRTALLSTLYYLGEQNIWVDRCNDEEMYEFTRRIAAHEIARDREEEIPAIVSWLERNSRRIVKNDRRLSFLGLKEALNRFGFDLVERGNLIEIYKDGTFQERILKKGKHGQEEYDQAYIADLRKRLNLTVDHGVDSGRFYGQKGVSDELNSYMQIRSEVFRRLADQ